MKGLKKNDGFPSFFFIVSPNVVLVSILAGTCGADIAGIPVGPRVRAAERTLPGGNGGWGFPGSNGTPSAPWVPHMKLSPVLFQAPVRPQHTEAGG